ncbi:Cthe_2314 family HEPN domain-containing protein [Cytobacillus sp. FSL R5-0596]|uniref:Cthe_2314 family HEPN domain-containing protein n=1 Tax=Cytobacillus sp. FSL R5-0596 TaxID=2954696 RepID=UPI0030F5B0DF
MFEEAGKKSYSVMSSEGITAMNLSYWINEHNNKAFDLINNYILLKHYFDKGIPDEEWVIEDNGKYKFFPHMEEKHDAYKYWFDFYMDSFYKRFATLIDTVCHLINIKYGFGIQPASGFRQNVMKKMRTEDETLFKTLKVCLKSRTYKQAERLRNDLTHNYRPNFVDAGIKERREGDKLIISGSLGHYTPTTELITNIEATIDLLADIIDAIRFKIQTESE